MTHAHHADDLRVVEVKTMRGPSVAHSAPVLIAELRVGALAAISPADQPEFMSRLLDALPAVGGDVGPAGAPPPRSALPRSWG
ncbi:MAG: hypothetical protein ABIW79_09210, partial [Gemmatimonas sp.]